MRKRQHHAQVKNARGIKDKRAKKIDKNCLMRHTHQKKKKNNIQVVDFDPRPKEFRRVTSKNINKFVVDLQALSADQKDVSMWETQLLITYKDYAIEPSIVPLLEEKGKLLLTNITPKDLLEIEGTVQQSQSDKWRSERWLRITASTCSDAYKVGKSVLTNSSNAASSSKKVI